MEVTLGGAVVNIGYAFVNDGGIVVEVIVEFALIHKLRMFGVNGFEFDGDLEVSFDVESLKDLSEGALVNFAYNFVVFTYLLWHLRHLW
jgi:hypothetical protein